MNGYTETLDLEPFVAAMRDAVTWARSRHRGDFSSVANRLERLSERVRSHVVQAADPARVATELEFEALLDLLADRVSEQGRAEIVAEMTDHGRRPLPEVLMELDPSQSRSEERATQVRVLKAFARSEIRDFVADPKVTAARACVLTLEELGRLVLYTERWPLEELEKVGPVLAEAVQLSLPADQRNVLAFVLDSFLFDALVGPGNPRPIGQFGPRGWHPVYEAIRPSSWELKPISPEVEAVSADAPQTMSTEAERTSHTPSAEGLVVPLHAPAPSVVEDAGNPGDYGQERAGKPPGRPDQDRDPLAIRVGSDSIMKEGPGRRAMSPFWSGSGVHIER